MLTMVSADVEPPCDRPNLSKDYLAGTASDDWIPLRSPAYYTENRIELMLGARAVAIDLASRSVHLEGGTKLAFGQLLLATIAQQWRLHYTGVKPPVPMPVVTLRARHGMPMRVERR